MARMDLGAHSTIRGYVRAKLNQLQGSDRSFSALYPLMFSEKDNILSERTDGYKIIRKTYGESMLSVESLSRKLCSATLNLKAGSIVGLYMQNCVEWIECLWAILKCGFVPLLMNTRLDGERLARVLSEHNIPLVISDGKLFDCTTLLYDDLAASTAEQEPVQWADELIVMSSGTSDKIKLCFYRGACFADQIEDSARIIAGCKQIKKFYHGHIKLLAFLPLYHIFGLSAMYMWFAFFARTFVFLKDYTPDTLLRTVRKTQVTHIFAVPLLWNKIHATFLKKLAERGEKTLKRYKKGYQISKKLGGGAFAKRAFKEVRDNIFGESVRFMITGGGAVSPEVLTFFNSIGYYLVNGYGMSEVGITSVELSPKFSHRTSGSVGRPLPHVEYKIEGGELLVRGSTTAYKIVCGQETTLLDGQWYHTQDLAKEENGRYFLLGRRDDMLVGEDGENINPDWAESRMEIAGSLNHCLVGLPCGRERVPALLVEINRFASEERLAAIRKNAEEALVRLSLAGAVKTIVLTDTPLLLENEFKLNRRRLSTALEKGELGLVTEEMARARSDDKLYCKIRALFAEVLDKDESEIGDEMHFFFDLGGTSIDYFALVSAIRREFDLPFPTTEQGSLSTVKGFCEYITNHI